MEKINMEAVGKAASVLRAIKHPLRQKLMEAIDTSGGKSNVTSIYKKLKLEQSVCSQHLAILRRANLVIAQREGKEIFYSVNHKRIEEVNKLAEKF